MGPLRYATLLATAAVLLSGCESDPVTGPPATGAVVRIGEATIYGAREVRPRSDWLRWYRQVDQCSLHDGDPGRVRWFLTDSIDHDSDGEPNALGLWAPPHRIYLGTSITESIDVVKHESAHDIAPYQGHDGRIFERCVP